MVLGQITSVCRLGERKHIL